MLSTLASSLYVIRSPAVAATQHLSTMAVVVLSERTRTSILLRLQAVGDVVAVDHPCGRVQADGGHAAKHTGQQNTLVIPLVRTARIRN